MNKINATFSLLLLGVIGLSSCNNNENGFTEYIHFDDAVLNENVNKLLDGFRMEGTIIQRRYNPQVTSGGEYVYDDYGNYVADTSIMLESNTYYTTVAFNGQEEKAYYKYSYRRVNRVEIPAEGPYTYFEDENGNAYSEEVSYDNQVHRVYNTSSVGSGSMNGYTFGDNGFYNFFSIFKESDFTLDTEEENYTRYDLNTHKTGILSNNLLYSLNSGSISLPIESYIRVDNGVFTSLSFELSAIASEDYSTGDITLITNEVTFVFSNIGESTIAHTTVAPDTEYKSKLESAFAPYANGNFTARVQHSYTSSESGLQTNDIKVLRFTGDEIYVHEGATDTQDLTTDYYLANYDDSEYLYPYTYNSETGIWEVNESGTSSYPSAYVGTQTYNDIIPVISGVSGNLFDLLRSDSFGEYYSAKDEYLTILSTCFTITDRPLADIYFISALDYIDSFTVQLNTDGSLAGISMSYSYLNSFLGATYTGTITTTYSNVGSTILPINA